jgi:hypothetical protein
VNGDDVLATWFWWHAYNLRGDLFPWAERDFGGSYGVREVDDLVRRVAAELDAGHSPETLIRNATFPPGSGSARYEASAVDWFLEQFLATPNPSDRAGMRLDERPDLPVANLITRRGSDDLAERPGSLSRRDRRKRQAETRRYLMEDCARAWRDFGELPGARLRWARVGLHRYELRTAEPQTIASARGIGVQRWTAGGRTYTVEKLDTSRSPDAVAGEIAARARRDKIGHFAAAPDEITSTAPEFAWALVDETGTPLLYQSGRNFAYRQYARITFPDRRWLRFWVRGTSRRDAIMTAVDQAGNKVIRYRRDAEQDHGTDIAVDPDQRLTEELVLAIAMSAPWLTSYFETPD